MDAVLIIIEKVGKSLSRVGLGTRLQYTLPRQCAHAFRPICCLFHYRLFVVASPLRRQALYFFDFVFVTESLACCHIVLSLSRRKKQTCCVLSCAFREDSANNVVVGDSQSAATVLVDQLVLRMLNILQHGL